MSNFWEDRYKSGGNSGAGSYGEFAIHKADVINKYIVKYGIKTISDFGCGDGNQISLISGFDDYMGYDISSYALYLCHEKFKGNKKMNFCSLMSDLPKADLCMSLDVLYHIINEEEYKNYLLELFNKSKRYVLIYSSNFDGKAVSGDYILHRKFTDWVDKYCGNFVLVEEIGNFLKTLAKFYLYERKN